MAKKYNHTRGTSLFSKVKKVSTYVGPLEYTLGNIQKSTLHIVAFFGERGAKIYTQKCAAGGSGPPKKDGHYIFGAPHPPTHPPPPPKKKW